MGYDGVALGRTGGRKEHDPAQHLDLNAGDDAAVETAIGLLKSGVQERRVFLAIRSGRQLYRDLVTLAAGSA